MSSKNRYIGSIEHKENGCHEGQPFDEFEKRE
jgi:hypothetical protein